MIVTPLLQLAANKQASDLFFSVGAPVNIKIIEKSIIDRAFKERWVRPQPARQQTWKRVAVGGSGPAGLAGAQQLARLGHQVTVFEKSDRLGGLLTYGIPDFKLEPEVMERRVQQMREEGVVFHTSTNAGKDIPAAELLNSFDALLLAAGAGYCLVLYRGARLPARANGSTRAGKLAAETAVGDGRRRPGGRPRGSRPCWGCWRPRRGQWGAPRWCRGKRLSRPWRHGCASRTRTIWWR